MYVDRQIVAVVVLSALLISLAGVFIWQEVRDDAYTSDNLRRSFPGYFRTPAEQSEIERVYFDSFDNPTPVETLNSTNNTCFFFCEIGEGFQRKKRSSKVRNGCCESSAKFHTPKKMKNRKNEERVIVQLGMVKQYFLIHDCKSVADCNGCRCSQSDELPTAVVVKAGIKHPDDMDDLEVDSFKVPGCCRCMNT